MVGLHLQLFLVNIRTNIDIVANARIEGLTTDLHMSMSSIYTT